MTNANIYGTTQAKTQPHAWREKANHWWSQIFWQQIWAICVTRTGASPSFLCLIFSHYLKVKHTYFSSQGSIIMSGFQPVIYSSKLTTPLTFLKASQKDGPRAYFSLTMLLAIKSVQMMHSQLGGWSKVHNLCFFCSDSHSINTMHSPKEGLGTSSWWSMHVPQHTSHWRPTATLLCRQSPLHARVV